jgi:hypothetical protein
MRFRGASRLKGASFGLAAAVACVVGTARTAEAAYTFDAGGNSYTITGFNQGTGDALAQGGVTAVAGGAGSTFQLYYEATATLANNGASLNPQPPGQITVIASITEVVTGVSGTTATFAVAANQSADSFLNMYYNATQTTNPYAGTGYTDGALILSAKPVASLQGDLNTFTNLGSPTPFDQSPTAGTDTKWLTSGPGGGPEQTDQGSGVYTVNFAVSSLSSSFFPAGNPALLSLHIFGGTNDPFSGVAPSTTFYGYNGGSPTNNVTTDIGTTNGSSGPDFMFQTNGTITPVPEPSSIALCGLGAIALAGCARRRRSHRA